MKSPTGNFYFKAHVNNTNKRIKGYAEVIIQIFNKKEFKLIDLYTGAGDANKWAVGWTKIGDTLILQSSDIGNKAWSLKNNHVIEIKLTNKLNKRADFLYSKKYK